MYAQSSGTGPPALAAAELDNQAAWGAGWLISWGFRLEGGHRESLLGGTIQGALEASQGSV